MNTTKIVDNWIKQYQKYQLHEHLAVKIYSSDIVYRELNNGKHF